MLFTYWRQYCSLWHQHWRTSHFIKTTWLSERTRLQECVNVDGGRFEHHYFVTVIALHSVHLDLTLIVLFWKIAFLVCRWKQIIILWSWNWTHLKFRAATQCRNVQMDVSVFSVIFNDVCSVLWVFSVLYLGGGALFSGHSAVNK